MIYYLLTASNSCSFLSLPRAMSRDFLQKQQYEEKTSTCRMLVTHLQKLSQATQSPADAEEDQASMNPSFTPLLERVPRRAESDPIGSPGAFLLRRDKEEMLFVPSASSLTRRRSKKEKRRNAPVVKVNLKSLKKFCLLLLASVNQRVVFHSFCTILFVCLFVFF